MQQRTGNEIRELFLRFFESKGHRRVHSSSLVPANDPTLLFTNAGMNQFKDLFLGAEKRDYSRATTSQKCVRAGGKHNDLENVGFTRRHHTFFEMLGNFSFGDYFKRDAIAYAWELVTSPEWYGLPKDKLYVTIFEGDPANGVPRDDEAEQFWLDVGVPKERIHQYGLKDNFWQMGETGPCGPCSEIFYDMGLEAAEHAGVDKPFGHDDARYVEIWNLVFMQFDRAAIVDPATKATTYKLTPLPKPSIDTGMGLERVSAVLQGKVSNFETDLFTPLIAHAAELTGLAKPTNHTAPEEQSSTRSLVSGHDFSRADKAQKEDGALAPVAPDKHESGHDFSRADKAQKEDGALAPVAPDKHESGHDFSRAETASSKEGALAPAEIAALVSNASLRIIADHARAATFLINDGVIPANEGRGYVLRKILRRGIRHGRLLGREQPFLYEMVYAVRDLMQGAYPELADSAPRVAKVVEAEEKQFSRAMDAGLRKLAIELAHTYHPIVLNYAKELKDYATQNDNDPYVFDQMLNLLSSDSEHAEEGAQYFKPALISVLGQDPQKTLLGTDAFHLYETFGLPLDFMVDAARDAGIAFDMEGFDAARAEEQARARASWKGQAKQVVNPKMAELADKTSFVGYSSLQSRTKVLYIAQYEEKKLHNLRTIDHVNPIAIPGVDVHVILEESPFYGTSGGQVGDTGWLRSTDGNQLLGEVLGCDVPIKGLRVLHVRTIREFQLNDEVLAVVDEARRDAIRRNHTGTHLLHAALRQVLGTHVKQAGSSVEPVRLRFDFSHFAQVADEELTEIESIVNREVLGNARVETLEDVPIDVAVNEYHAMALFGEKYGDKVRVVKLSDGFSTELCGGTHTSATGEIGLIKIVSEGSVSSGVRRLEAITGFGSLDTFRQDFEVAKLAGQYVPSTDNLTEGLRAKFASQEEELKRLRRELEEARMKSAAGALDEALSKAIDVKGVRLVTLRADSLERGQLRTLVDNLKQKLGEGVVVLASAQPEGKVALIAGVTPALTKRIQAGKLVGAVAKLVGGSGGGKPEIAEAGGKDPAQIDAALQAAPQIVAELLG
jgi:alanyl-tRNA synthetase